MKTVRYILWVIISVLFASSVWIYLQPDQLPEDNPVIFSEVTFGQPFTLIDNKGQEITEKAFEGHPNLLFFGFTNCPEICPTTLYEINTWLDELGDEAKDVKSFFISIDPERDTVAIMNDYVSAISDRIVGITGTEAEIAELVKSWRVYAKKIPEIGANDGLGNYNMDHTASVLLVRADGTLQGTITYGENTAVALDKIRLLLKN